MLDLLVVQLIVTIALWNKCNTIQHGRLWFFQSDCPQGQI
jgi:hypothetical protein